jgi:CubicO group peptidase (beta-lactamase class C family)
VTSDDPLAGFNGLASAAVDHPLETALGAIDGWGAEHAAAAVIGRGGIVASHGDLDRRFRWASVTKLVTAMAVLDAVEDGVIDLDEPAGPTGATVRHLLAHASGLPFEGEQVIAEPGTRRIYSNPGFDVLGALLAQRDAVPVGAALRHRVLDALGITRTELVSRASEGLHGTLGDLAVFARELLRPKLVTRATLDLATEAAFPGLAGMLPGVGRFDPLDWGLGFELRDAKVPHWTGSSNSAGTFGHFGGAGGFLWVDPALDRALAVLTDRDYGAWALTAWPGFSDDVIARLTAPG